MFNHAGIEKRRFPRLNFSLDIDYLITGTGMEKIAQTKNVSAGGICLVVSDKIEPNAILELKIYLPNYSSPILTKGRVVWESEVTTLKKGRIFWPNEANIVPDQITRFELGIEFLDIDEADQQRISQFLSPLIPEKK